MCYNVLQCVFSTLDYSTHWGTLGFLNVFRNVHERQCVSQCVSCGFRNVSKTHWLSMGVNVPPMFFQCVFLHIETHWNTLKHIVVIVAKLHKNVPDYNVFQCVVMCANVRSKHIQCGSMCLQFFFNAFLAHWKYGKIPMCIKHIEKKLEAHWRTLNVF